MLPSKLYHYSPEILTELRQDFHNLHRERAPVISKPHGFWISVEDYEEDQNWRTWCEGEEFRLESLRYKHLIKIKESRILFLKNREELETFSHKYSGNDRLGLNQYQRRFNDKPYICWIDWETVTEEYDGIIIAPYQWDCRMMNSITAWYYGWDCASGCIWNMDAIESFIMVEEIEEIRKEEKEMDSHTESQVHSP